MEIEKWPKAADSPLLGKLKDKIGPRKIDPRKNGPRTMRPRKNVLQKLFYVKKMLGNLNDFFIFIDWFHYTHKKMFDVHVTILHAPNCRTLKESRKVCCRVLGFHRLITSQYFTYTPHDARSSPHNFLFLSFPGLFLRRPFFNGPFLRGPFFPGTIFPGTIFPGNHFSGDHFPGIPLVTRSSTNILIVKLSKNFVMLQI